jgi:adenylate cyclase
MILARLVEFFSDPDVLRAAVQRSGSHGRKTAQLIHGPSDTHRWANSYERNLVEILTLQDEVTRPLQVNSDFD